MREKMSKQPPPAPTASAVGPCPTVLQIVGRPGTGSLPSTITPPDPLIWAWRHVGNMNWTLTFEQSRWYLSTRSYKASLKAIGLSVLQKIVYGFCRIWVWRQCWSYDLDHLNTFFVPLALGGFIWNLKFSSEENFKFQYEAAKGQGQSNVVRLCPSKLSKDFSSEKKSFESLDGHRRLYCIVVLRPR